ncbi:uncharacterized protein LODBEIA_P26390 [Lodderomyces beijingensis]|uniref:Splicing factor U2AF 23 kDa subunit n=1 Tax=Lodderomyces beijingensis TaxID=1775926 RepID=A0ABP0ZQD5_9ASCO
MSYTSRRYDQGESISCAFYSKIGACRHGEKCSKKHIKPTSSRTLLLANLYQNPKMNKSENEDSSPQQLQETLDLFYQDVFVHLSRKCEVASMIVCENENNHLNGNVYVRFYSENDAARVNQELNQEWFNGKPVHSDLSPVSNFDEARCRAYDTDTCERGEMCNYMHLREPSASIMDKLTKGQEKKYLSRQLEKLKAQLAEFPPPSEKPNGDDDASSNTTATTTTNSLLSQLE